MAVLKGRGAVWGGVPQGAQGKRTNKLEAIPMKIKATSLILIASLTAPAMVTWGDMADMKTKHADKEVQSQAADATVYKQKMKETKAQLDQAQKDLAAAQDPKVREQAQKRVKSLQKEYNKLAKKT